MARGHPDGGEGGSTTIIHTVTDLGELAARLGSIVTYHRSGNVIYYEDFENTLSGWWVDAAGAGASILISTDYCFRGGQCAIVTGSTSSVNDNKLEKRLPGVPTTVVGLEVFYRSLEEADEIEFLLDVYLGGFRYRVGVRLTPADNTIDLANAVAGYEEVISDWLTINNTATWHNIKFTFDVTTLKYVSLLVNGVSKDVSAVSVTGQSTSQENAYNITLSVKNNSGEEDITLLDDAIITINEPTLIGE